MKALSNDLNNQILSKTITYLRFPLIVAVVLIHANLSIVNVSGSLLAGENNFPIYDILYHIISDEFARIAVPLFFFFSGFLFFNRTNFTLLAYYDKLKKRVHTLLVPYLFWNLLVLFAFLLLQLLLPAMTSGDNKLITDYSFSDFLAIFWNCRPDGFPMCYQFWFIRDLMVVVVLSPLVYCFVRYLKIVGVILLGLLCCFNLWYNIPGFSSVAFFFFSFGAWFAIHKHNFVVDFKQLRIPLSILYILLVGLSTSFWYSGLFMYSVHFAGIICGLISVVSWTAFGVERNKLVCNNFLAGSSFFVYGYHGLFIALLCKIWMKTFQPATDFVMVSGYVIIPIVVVLLGVAIYYLLHKYLPRFTGIITGGR